MTINNTSRALRLSIPSKGRLSESAQELLEACDLKIYKPNPRQYIASIPNLPGLQVLFQRAGDIVVGVRDGSVDFGITGRDIVEEKRGENGDIIILHDRLGFGYCDLMLAIPEDLPIESNADLIDYAKQQTNPLRIATKFPNLTTRYLTKHAMPHTLVYAEGTLENAPTIGYADMIADLVSSGQTLRDNRLRPIPDAVIQASEACLVANRKTLETNPDALAIAVQLLEAIEAHQRANENMMVTANIRGETPDQVAEKVFEQPTIRGLQGPTISEVYVHNDTANWFSVQIIVHRDQLLRAICELRAIGGSGVIVSPVTYIFEEEPARVRDLLARINA